MISTFANGSLRCAVLAASVLYGVVVLGQAWEHVRNVPLGDRPVGTLTCMDVQGDLLVIGFATPTGGVVRVHERNEEGLGQWGVVQELIGDEPYFGHAVAISGTRIAIGIPGADHDGALTGSVLLCVVLPGAVEDPVQVVDTLRGLAAGDRFGYSLAWCGDSLAIGAVGRSLDRFTGEVPLFGATAGAVAIGSLQARWQDLQVPFTRYFGMSIAQGGDHLAVSAPFAGFRNDVPQQNIGALFMYERNASEPTGWALDTVWSGTNVLPDGCTFEHLELGRNGAGFVGDALVLDHGVPYSGGPGTSLLPFRSLGDVLQGCASCRLRVATHQEGQWSFDAMVDPQHPAELDRIAERGWTTDPTAIYVERVNSSTGVWATTIHQRDSGGPGVWGVEAVIPALDEACDKLAGPITVSGNDLMRIALRSGTCDVPENVVRAELQIFSR
ncbi:MAG: FG-GAP repeat protein [Flavobacteriales bacterium]|nr:FG-GAP repeat protein [Flavobacteriales bacterium]